MDEALTVADFLETTPGAFCDGCLCDTLRIPRDDVKTAIFSRSRVFARVYGRCAMCRQPNAVTAIRRAA